MNYSYLNKAPAPFPPPNGPTGPPPTPIHQSIGGLSCLAKHNRRLLSLGFSQPNTF